MGGGGFFPNELKCILQRQDLYKELEKFGGGGGGGCIWIIASTIWSRVFRIRLVNLLKGLRQRLDWDQELDNKFNC